MSIYVSSTLTVSQKEPIDCADMAKMLSKAGIYTSISYHISCQPEIEYGCRLTQPVSNKNEIRNIWTELKKHYPFKCAHLKVADTFDGCVLNYLAPSCCNN